MKLFLLFILSQSSHGFLVSPQFRASFKELHLSSNGDYITVKVNQFFQDPVPKFLQELLTLKNDSQPPRHDFDFMELLTAPPTKPGIPRPLWLVCLASIPTGLLWYGYYKFAVEEELLALELESGKEPRGFGGYGTLGPFTYGIICGPIAAILHLPGGIQWTTRAIVWIYYTQFLLYDRVNQLYKELGEDPPLTVWWCLPIFFPFNLIVGLRQVHFLSQYWYRKRGMRDPPNDPVADFFPFIAAENFTWQEFLTEPSLWCILLRNQKSIDKSALPESIQELLSIGKTVPKSRTRK